MIFSTVLLVDDDEGLCEVFSDFIESCGNHRCRYAHSLSEVQRVFLESSNFSLVILDVNLGRHQANGVEVYRWIRQAGFNGRIVFLTGHAQAFPELQNIQATEGIEILEKPIDTHRIERLLAGEK